jgi:hypothetical protein
MKFIAASVALSLGLASPAAARLSHIPITYRETSGIRPYVPVTLNGTRLLFMVHAQNDGYAMTTHANAAKAGVTDLVQKGKYGITQTGKVSNLGRASAHAATFVVGGSVTRAMPIDVFEVPQTPPVDGMIGVKWLRQAGAFVDYARGELLLPQVGVDADAERAALLKQGYVAHPMIWDSATNHYLIHPTIGSAHVTFSVSTVASDLLDEPFARSQAIPLVLQEGTYGGPTGTTGHFYKTKSAYPFSLDGSLFRTVPATVFDAYAYEAKPRPVPADAIAGTIGCDFMRNSRAVIDFGSGTLYLPRR